MGGLDQNPLRVKTIRLPIRLVVHEDLRPDNGLTFRRFPPGQLPRYATERRPLHGQAGPSRQPQRHHLRLTVHQQRLVKSFIRPKHRH